MKVNEFLFGKEPPLLGEWRWMLRRELLVLDCMSVGVALYASWYLNPVLASLLCAMFGLSLAGAFVGFCKRTRWAFVAQSRFKIFWLVTCALRVGFLSVSLCFKAGDVSTWHQYSIHQAYTIQGLGYLIGFVWWFPWTVKRTTFG